MSQYRVTDNCPDGADYGVGPHSFSGDATISGGLKVTGTTTLANITYTSETVSGDSTVAGGESIGKTLTVSGNAALTTMSCSGDATVSGGLKVTKTLTASADSALTTMSCSGDATVSGGLKVTKTFTSSGNVSFFGKTPTGQQAAGTGVTALDVGGIGTLQDTSGIWGFDSSANLTSVLTAINTLQTAYLADRTAMIKFGFIA